MPNQRGSQWRICDDILTSYHDVSCYSHRVLMGFYILCTFLQSPGLLRQLCNLSLKPSTQSFTWPFVREVAGIDCSTPHYFQVRVLFLLAC